MKKTLFATMFIFTDLLICSLMTTQTPAAAGDLDLTFGTGGTVYTHFSNYDSANAVAPQADGKIFVAGRSDENFSNLDFVLVRYNVNGSLDATFDSDGKAISDFGNTGDGTLAVTIQPDGKIVAAGFSFDSFALARYNSDGSPGF